MDMQSRTPNTNDIQTLNSATLEQVTKDGQQ
jgi:hypothetical protein